MKQIILSQWFYKTYDFLKLRMRKIKNNKAIISNTLLCYWSIVTLNPQKMQILKWFVERVEIIWLNPLKLKPNRTSTLPCLWHTCPNKHPHLHTLLENYHKLSEVQLSLVFIISYSENNWSVLVTTKYWS